MRFKKMQSECVTFGALCFTKLKGDLQNTAKSNDKGAACCYLGPCSEMRNSCNVMYLVATGPDAGSYRHTTVPEDQLIWPEKHVMAFTRKFEDLHTVAAPGEVFSKLGGPILSKEPEEATKSPKANKPMYEQTQETLDREHRVPEWQNKNSMCPACRGGHRKHTYRGDGPRRCRWAGLDEEKVKILRREGSELADDTRKDQLMQDVATNVAVKGMTWSEAYRQFLDEVKDILNQKLAKVFGVSEHYDVVRRVNSSTNRAKYRGTGAKIQSGVLSGEMQSGVLSGEISDFENSARIAWVQFHKYGDEGVESDQADGLFAYVTEHAPVHGEQEVVHCDAAAVSGEHIRASQFEDVKLDDIIQAYRIDADTGKPKFRKNWNDLQTEFDQMMITERDRVEFTGRDYYLQADDELEEAVHYARYGEYYGMLGVYVTRNMSKSEKSSPKGQAAMASELLKVLDMNTFGQPVHEDDALRNSPQGTRSKFCMLTYLKGVESKNPVAYTFARPKTVAIVGGRIAEDVICERDTKQHVSKGSKILSVQYANGKNDADLSAFTGKKSGVVTVVLDEPKYKGRLVVLGNKIYRLRDGTQTYPTGKADGLHGDVASLAAFRSVASHSTRAGYVMESADVANAYLNAPWPEKKPLHYLSLDLQIYKLLPAKWRDLVDASGGWQKALLPMERCLYGHPLSGFIWISQLHNWLIEHGFKEVVGTKALYQKGKVLVCGYVDDLAVAGPAADVAELWDELDSSRRNRAGKPGTYDLREVGECKEFLGIKVNRYKCETGNGFVVDLVSEDYCDTIIKAFETDFQSGDDDDDDSMICVDGSRLSMASAKKPKAAKKSNKKLTKVQLEEQCRIGGLSTEGTKADLISRLEKTKQVRQKVNNVGVYRVDASSSRIYSAKTSMHGRKVKGVQPKLVPMTAEQNEKIKDQHLWESVVPTKRVQKLMGQLLWISRCTRTDVSYATSRLASAISRWNDKIHTPILRQVIGYLKQTRSKVLRFKPENPKLKTRLEIHTDASWHVPRSQSGFVLVKVQYEVNDKGEPVDTFKPIVLALLDWGSKRQSLTADSSAASELVAAHYGVREALPLALDLIKFWSVEQKVALRIDNQAIVHVAHSGATKGLTWLGAKPMNIRAGCIYDCAELGLLQTEFIDTKGQLADIGTKALDRLMLQAEIQKLGIVDPSGSLFSQC